MGLSIIPGSGGGGGGATNGSGLKTDVYTFSGNLADENRAAIYFGVLTQRCALAGKAIRLGVWMPNTFCTGGTMTVEVYRNNVATGMVVVLDPYTTPQYKILDFAYGTYPFEVGDMIAVFCHAASFTWADFGTPYFLLATLIHQVP